MFGHTIFTQSEYVVLAFRIVVFRRVVFEGGWGFLACV